MSTLGRFEFLTLLSKMPKRAKIETESANRSSMGRTVAALCISAATLFLTATAIGQTTQAAGTPIADASTTKPVDTPLASSAVAATTRPTTSPAVEDPKVVVDPKDSPATVKATPTDSVKAVRPGTFEIHVQGADLRGVLQLVSTQGRKNIISTKEVTGSVTADLYRSETHTSE